MSAPILDFEAAREQVFELVKEALAADSLVPLETRLGALNGSDAEKKQAVDQCLKDVLEDLIRKEADTQQMRNLVQIATNAVKADICTPSTPFIMLSDMFDSITLDLCGDVFQFVEDRVQTWKSELFYNAGKNYLLRMCNDLLRRMSKSQNTVFCGRIQLFLARLFPLSEKSGLNLMSVFNLENTTLYTTRSEDYDRARKMSVDGEKVENMDIEEGEMDEQDQSSIPIDYNLYRKFWALQDFFRKPTQCFDKAAFKTFANYSEEVLICFQSYKLDDTKISKHKIESQKDENYFPKYLTSEKLLDLQLSDSNFRRYVLVQFLILFQYLNAQVRFKSTSQVLTDDSNAWVKGTLDLVYQILKQTPPDGEVFAKTIEHMLNREENWNSWKNENCPSYVRNPVESKAKPRAKKRSLGEDLKASGGKLIKMGNAELTRLWNLCPDNLEACRLPSRNFLPSMEGYFENAIEQMDPEAQVDKEYWDINNKNFSWKALRLLAKKSPHFFAQTPTGNTGQVSKTVPQYLESMLNKIAKEMPSADDTSKNDVDANEEGENDNNDEEEDDENGLDKDSPKNEEGGEGSDLATKDHLSQLAEALGMEWKTLATELNFPEDDVVYFESDSSDTMQQALKMLTVWQENDPERATTGALRQALKEIGQLKMATNIFGDRDDS